ncbi:MAG: AbrB/MazE/SpoVT family DNA-binding domain-containing protein [Nanoarchaeota archaeon]
MITKATLKHWGSSLGLVVPHEVVKTEHLREGEEVVIEIQKQHSMKDIFGSLPHWKIDSQKMKDELRKEWAE